MDLIQINPAIVALMGFVVAGITELLNRLRAKDYWVAATIVTAAVTGGFLGVYYDFGAVTGALAGFFAAGGIKFAGSIGNKSVPTPSTVLERKPAE